MYKPRVQQKIKHFSRSDESVGDGCAALFSPQAKKCSREMDDDGDGDHSDRNIDRDKKK